MPRIPTRRKYDDPGIKNRLATRDDETVLVEECARREIGPMAIRATA